MHCSNIDGVHCGSVYVIVQSCIIDPLNLCNLSSPMYSHFLKDTQEGQESSILHFADYLL